MDVSEKLKDLTVPFSTFDRRIVLAGVALGIVACQRVPLPSEAFVAESSRVQALTAPTGTHVVDQRRALQQPMRVSQEWHIESPESWSEYVRAVVPALAPAYRCSSQGTSTSCSRSTSGDSFQLVLAPEPGASRLVVRVLFQALPD